jgi:hypothetical protein
MPPQLFSRFQFCVGYIDPVTGLLTLTDRDPYRFAPFSDNIQHAVKSGDTLFSIANRYYAAMKQAPQLWWVIADFQPEPILDPTIQLEIGRVLQIPSLQTLQTEIFASTRQQTSAT